ncbi:hypothetical protein CRM22_009102 [Opisthorchis felineus]|uniref:Uncharacterized protein n=1 Tax=Opisthorchis felineus TaxID=147828 RepID=A0A4S2LFC4_OPIFE|nr:hypothetical protein CRM22_009102 [Opisthorchis felineus]
MLYYQKIKCVADSKEHCWIILDPAHCFSRNHIFHAHKVKQLCQFLELWGGFISTHLEWTQTILFMQFSVLSGNFWKHDDVLPATDTVFQNFNLRKKESVTSPQMYKNNAV